MFPNVKDIIVSFDYKAKKLVVDESKLKELYRNLRQFKSPFDQDNNFKIYIIFK